MSNVVTLKQDTKTLDIGIEQQQRADVATALASFLASSYTLYIQTQSYHWNVTGPHFGALHDLFEEQYTELRDAIDEIAERIRALGFAAPGSLQEFAALSTLKEVSLPSDASGMIAALLSGHEHASRQARDVLAVGEAAEDEVTVDMMIERMQEHDKTAWMLRAHLES